MENNAAMPMLFPVEPEKFWERMRLIIREEIKSAEIEKPPLVDETEPLLTRKEIAEYLKISLVTLHDCMKNRGLPYHSKRVGTRFLKSEVLEWVKENKDSLPKFINLLHNRG